MQDIVVDNLFMPSFEYNSQTPRFYSKYFLEDDPAKYNIFIWQMVAATSAAPVYFDPFTMINGLGI